MKVNEIRELSTEEINAKIVEFKNIAIIPATTKTTEAKVFTIVAYADPPFFHLIVKNHETSAKQTKAKELKTIIFVINFSPFLSV